MTIGIAADGTVYTNRFNGWYKTSSRLLESDLKAGCYNDANPARVSSVTLNIAPNAPKARLESLFAMFSRLGWPKEKVLEKMWSDSPSKPPV